MTGSSGVQILFVFPGIFVSLLGSAMVLKPRRIARFQEQMDAIGSKRNVADVEPAEWNVTLNQIAGGFILLMGVYVLLRGLGISPI